MNTTWVEFILNAPPLVVLALKMTLLLAGAWTLHFALARVNPRWRVLLWRGTAVGLLAMPALMLAAPELELGLAVAPPPPLILPDFVPPLLPEGDLEPAVELDALEPPPVEVAPPAAPLPMWVWLTGGWGLGALLMALRFAHAQRAMGRLAHRGTPAPEAAEKVFAEIARGLGVSGVRLVLSAAVRTPLLYGMRRPVVLLPRRMAEPAFAADMPAIFAHELSHVRSRDLAWLGLARLAQTLAWPHPLAWGMHAACAAAGERVCDASAAGALRDGAAYARSLARVALALAGRPVGQAALAMAIPDIRRRLQVLQKGLAARPLRRGAVRLAALMGLALLVVLAALKPVAAEPKSAVETSQQELITQTFKIHEKDGTRIKSLINSIISASTTTLGMERKVTIDKDDLIVRDTPENMKKIEELLKDKKFLQGAKNERSEKLNINNFSLVPRDIEILSEQIGTFGDRVVNAIENFLYPENGAAKANVEGRKLWYDRQTLQLTIVDTPANLARVGQYLESLPYLNNSSIRQEEIHLSNITAEAALKHIQPLIDTSHDSHAIVFKLHIGQSRKFSGLEFSDLEIQGGKPEERGDDTVSFQIDTGKQQSHLGMNRGLRMAWGERILMCEDIDPPHEYVNQAGQRAQSPGSLRLRVEWVENKKDAGSTSATPKLKGIKVYVADANDRLIVRYNDPKSLQAVKDLVAKIDTKNPGKAAAPDQSVIVIDQKLITRTYALAPSLTGKVRALHAAGELQKNIWGQAAPPAPGCTITLDESRNTMVVTGSKLHLARVESLLPTLKSAAAPEIQVRIYKIDAKDGPRIKSLINPIVVAPYGATYDHERKIFVDKDDLIVRDTPENIKKIEELLKDKKFIRDMQDDKLDIQNFSLMPRDTEVVSDQIRSFTARVVEAIKVFLYPDGDEAMANREGRKMSYDPQTLQLTIVDRPSNLARVRQYVDSLPYLGGQTRQEVVFLTYAVADDLAVTIQNNLKITAGRSNEMVAKRRLHESFKIRDLTVTIHGLEKAANGEPKDDWVELKLELRGKTPQTVTKKIRELDEETLGDYTIIVEDVTPPYGAQPGVTLPNNAQFVGGSARVRVRIDEKQKEEPKEKAPEPPITIQPFGELNALIVRYRVPEGNALFKDVKDLIQQLDKPMKQITIESMLLVMKDKVTSSSIENLFGPALGGPVADLDRKLKELERGGRARVIRGPKMISLDGTEAVWRIEDPNPADPTGKTFAATLVAWVTPEVTSKNEIRMMDSIITIDSGQGNAQKTIKWQSDFVARKPGDTMVLGNGNFIFLLRPKLVY